MQRSSYTLSVPFRYGLPMMAFFAAGHWLLPQSTFIIRVNTFDWKGDPRRGYTTAGYSFIPCLLGKSQYLPPNPKKKTKSPCTLLIAAGRNRQSLPPLPSRSNRSRYAPQVH